MFSIPDTRDIDISMMDSTVNSSGEIFTSSLINPWTVMTENHSQKSASSLT